MNYSTNFGLKLPQRGVEMANVNDLNDNTEDIDTIMHQNRTMLGEAYDPDKVDGYTEGEFVVQLGQFYECISDTSGVWDPTAWQLTDIGTILKALADGGGGGHTYSTQEQVVGKWIDGSTVYERTVIINNPLTNIRTNIDDPIFTNCNIISMSGYAKRSVAGLGGAIIAYNVNTYESSTYFANVFYDEYLGKLAYQLYFSTDTCTELAITIRYIKTTV